MTAILEIEGLTRRFGGLTAVDDLSFSVDAGEIHGLIGPNGAGKTTTFNVISGFYPPSSGAIRFDGQAIEGLAPHKIAALGLVRTFQHTTLFKVLSVLDNLLIGAHLRRDQAGLRTDLETVFDHFPRLRERQGQWAKTLSGSEQQMLAIGRALMRRPKLLLLDEPSIGLAPVMVQEIAGTIRTINQQAGVPVVLVQQNAALALDLASYAYVFKTGRISLEGRTAELRQSDHIQRAYLGG